MYIYIYKCSYKLIPRKGTVCDGLKKRYGLVHISPGQILRDEVSKESELGLQAKRASKRQQTLVVTSVSKMVSFCFPFL